MDSKLKAKLLAEKNSFEMLGIKYLTPEDKKVINYVSGQIANIKTGAVPVRETVTLGMVFLKSLDNLRIFGETCYNEALKFASTKFVPMFSDNISYSCFVAFDIDGDTMKPIIDSGKVDHFGIPQIIDTNGEIHLTHELIHALKETNYKEYILSNVVSDVIPIFYELISTDNNEQLKKDKDFWIKAYLHQ